MNKYGFAFDWQENRGYEKIEELNKHAIEVKKVNFSKCIFKMTWNKSSGHNSGDRLLVRKIFGLKVAHVFLK